VGLEVQVHARELYSRGYSPSDPSLSEVVTPVTIGAMIEMM
jgi:hypothetical protein